ncbi:DUF4468 domain-containing protein [Salinibacter ruber]|uniref:DUF4468 domain-containing protein n=1 Tax=Salinibacter ruber TaxID=146919 RepID=UPI00216789F6|nr:DUF4468 domain-containing protein [Salinibacter ruber]MCS4197338.1 hypothetical protein [Salinibacter ruber]
MLEDSSRAISALILSCGILFLFGCSPSVNMTEVKPVTSIESHPHDKNTAFSRAEEWMAKNYVSADEVIQMKDKEDGTIVAQGIREATPWGTIGNKHFSYTLTLDIRDEKMRFTYELNGWEDFMKNQEQDVKNMKEWFRNELKPEILSFVRQEDTF